MAEASTPTLAGGGAGGGSFPFWPAESTAVRVGRLAGAGAPFWLRGRKLMANLFFFFFLVSTYDVVHITNTYSPHAVQVAIFPLATR